MSNWNTKNHMVKVKPLDVNLDNESILLKDHESFCVYIESCLSATTVSLRPILFRESGSIKIGISVLNLGELYNLILGSGESDSISLDFVNSDFYY